MASICADLKLLLTLLLTLTIPTGLGFRFIEPSGTTDSDVATTKSISESAAVSTTVQTIRSDTACTYEIITAGATDCTTTDVKLDPSVGSVTSVALQLNQKLDYETKKVRICAIKCNAAAAKTATVTISVINVWDATPSSTTTSYSATIEENKAVDTAVTDTAATADLEVTFTDGEVTSSSDVLTCGITGTGSAYFKVVTTATATGCKCAMRTKSVLDRETLSADSFSAIYITATDKGGLVGSVTVSVSVLDKNDNSPSCTKLSYSESVSEGTSSATLATIATCTDADKGDNAVLAYAMVGTPTGYSLTGNVLSLTAAKDYDTITTNPEIIYVTISDSAATPGDRLIITATVSVTILGVNDNTPAIGAVAAVTIAEGASIGTTLFTPSATDGDKAGEADSTLTWSIVSATTTAGTSTGLNLADYFTIDGSTGIIKVGTKPLDYETWTTAEINVKVVDGGTPAKSATATFTLSITDVNEFAPTFSPSNYYHVSLAENKLENFTVLDTFSATDPDGSDLPVWCEIISGNTDSVFRFNKTNRNVLELAKTIEPDAATNHPLLFELTVECKDNNGTSPFKSSTATIQVDITTSNDITPTVTGTSGCPSTSRCNEATTLTGATVGTLIVSDNDVGADGEFDCKITSPAGGPFSLQGCSTIVLAGSLDYEQSSIYRVVVQATDRGTPARVGSSTVSIYVEDVDDNAPFCTTYDYSFSISENSGSGTSVGTILCKDNDAAGVTYTLVPSTVPFTITGAANNAELKVGAAGLDYESTTSYEFTVRTTDQGSLGRTADAIVRVNVLPYNEQTPAFSNTAISVDEDTVVGTVIKTFSAADSDTGGHGIVSYAIQSVTNSGSSFFSISSSGEVALLKTLDYETTTTYKLTVTATDGGGLIGTGTLTVNVNDKNDNSPVCTNAQVSLTMAENAMANTAATGTQPVATDADSATLYGLIKYTIASGDTGSFFTIDGATGTVRRSGTSGLSYETLTPPWNFYNLTIHAVDENGAGANTATCLAKVTITDVEEGAPIFATSIASATALAETTAVGTDVYTPAYTHVDKWDIPTFTLDPTNSLFSIDSSTGKVTLAAALDYETATQHVLTLVATDKNGNKGSMTLTVPVTNSNEYSPICTPVSTTVYIDENDQSSPSFPKDVMSFTCSDNDADTTLLYSVIKVDGTVGTGNYQFVSNTLRTTAALNYEAPNTNDILEITVSDQGPGTANVVTFTVTVSINPVNEYAPVFTASSLTPSAVDESVSTGTTVATLVATDADTGSTHRTIKYGIVSGNEKGYFSLADASGIVTNVKSLDREDAAQYLLTVSATDGPGLNTTATVTISLNDINDNSPVFTKSIYTVSVYENAAVGSTVLSFVGKITDADATSTNNAVKLTIETASVPFTFDTGTNRDLQVSSALNAGTNPTYTLTIRGKDKNGAAVSDARTTDIQVIINVLEVNTAAPSFSGATTQNVAENTAVGASIATATATDSDSGLSGTITYSFGSGNTNNDFAINPTSGLITLTNALDFDAGTKVYYLAVVATDQGSPAKSTTWTLTVSVTDVNDNYPTWTEATYTLSIAEDIGGTFPQTIHTMSVSDADSGDNGKLVLSLVSQSGTAPDGATGLFGVDSTSKSIRLMSKPDREFRSSYDVVIKACDSGTTPLCSQKLFTITISDANDNTPNFGLCPKEITIPEDVGGDVLITTIAATDNDAGVNGQISGYALVSADGGASSPTGLLTVSSTGGITTATTPSFDRETKSFYQFYLTAVDNGTPSRLTGSCLLNVSISDKNDNTPVISGTPIITTVSEAAVGGTIFYTVAATDADTGVNADLLFDITAYTPANNFTINNKGQISVFSGDRLDRERNAAYNLTVRVRDRGTDPGQRTASVTVSINVGDVNDNIPSFGSTSIQRSVAENSVVGANVGAAVGATDPDLGESASITYKITDIIVPTSGGDYFDVTPLTGQLTVKVASLDRETRDIYILELSAIDNGSPSLTGSTTVTISITDVNDNTPVFAGSYTSGVSVDENSAVDTSVATFSATDIDIGVNGELVYAIDTARLNGSLVDTYFKIDSTNGHLTVKAAIDRETYSVLQFYVLCEDKGSTVRTASASVNLYINDVNDNTPVFNPVFYNTEMYYKEDRTSVTLATVSATDADATGNSINYGWGSTSANFVINTVTGGVTPGASQATSKDSRYVQYPTALDAGSPRRTATATIRIDTYDVNDVSVCVTYTTIESNFLANQATLEKALGQTIQFKYPTVRCETWKYTASSSSVKACHYCVQDNTTDSVANIATAKLFVTQSDLLVFWRLNSNGDPTAMLQTTNFSSAPIALVEGYSDPTTATTTTPWYQTPWGITILVLGSAIVASLIGGGIGALIHYLNNRSPTIKVSKPSKFPTVPRDHPKPLPKARANKNMNVYRDKKLWRGTPEFGRNFRDSPGEIQRTGHSPNNSRTPTPVS